MKVIVEADGGSRDNPGPAGYGALVRDTDSGEVLVERAEGIGVATNNVAEYQGLPAGLDAVAQLGSDEVPVRMESKLVVEPEHVRIGSRSRPRCWWSSPPERGRYGSAAARWHEHHRPGSDYRLHNAAVAISDFSGSVLCAVRLVHHPGSAPR
jgi:ribonuclease HI